MPTRKIDELIWKALTDSAFRKKLLNNQRKDALTTANLTEAERKTVLRVKANTLEAFAGALCQPGSSVWA